MPSRTIRGGGLEVVFQHPARSEVIGKLPKRLIFTVGETLVIKPVTEQVKMPVNVTYYHGRRHLTFSLTSPFRLAHLFFAVLPAPCPIPNILSEALCLLRRF